MRKGTFGHFSLKGKIIIKDPKMFTNIDQTKLYNSVRQKKRTNYGFYTILLALLHYNQNMQTITNTVSQL